MDGKDTYNIKQVSSYLGVSADTLRNFEETGILTPARNEDNNYREYNREDLIYLDYVMRMRRLGIPLKSIKNMIRDNSVEQAADALAKQKFSINEQIHVFMRRKRMIDDYLQTFHQIMDNCGITEITRSPAFICRDIQGRLIDTMSAFNDLSEVMVPKLTFTIRKNAFNYENMSRFADDDVKSKNRQSLTLEDDDNFAHRAGFPIKGFYVIEPSECVHALIKIRTNKDYSSMLDMWEYVRKNALTVTGDIIMRALYIQYYKDAFYDVWIPIEK